MEGNVSHDKVPVEFASVAIEGTAFGTTADSTGSFQLANLPAGKHTVLVSAIGYKPYQQSVTLTADQTTRLDISLQEAAGQLDEVVVTGTMKEVSKLASPVPVDIITQKFLYKNPVSSIFEALTYVNGVRPQLNCNVCNTGDIHINGLEGPYTMVLLDGTPIVSGLSTVYGLVGIPNSLIERVEVVKGPASTLYGSEAVGRTYQYHYQERQQGPDFFGGCFQQQLARPEPGFGF